MPNRVIDNGEGAVSRADEIHAADMGRRAEEIRIQRLIDDVEHWRNRAEELRTEAAFMEDSIARATILDTAMGYETFARRIQERLGMARRPKQSQERTRSG
jgi:hypothetical protein